MYIFLIQNHEIPTAWKVCRFVKFTGASTTTHRLARDKQGDDCTAVFMEIGTVLSEFTSG